MEGDSLCVIRWATGRCKPPWDLADITEEVHVLARRQEASFTHVKCIANSTGDILAGEGVSCNGLVN